MQFSDASGKQGIIEDITFLIGQDVNSFSLDDRTRCVNMRLSIVWQIIFESYGGWKFMDDNQSDASTGVPYADQTLTSGTGLYALPTGTLSIDMVEIKYDASQPFRRLFPLTYEQFIARGGDAAFPSNAMPLYYLPQGDIIRMLPTPNFTLANALRVFFEKDFTQFGVADTTVTPGFASPFHRMLSVGAALDFSLSHGMADNVVYLTNMWNDYEKRLRDFYAKRYLDRFPARIGPGSDLVENYS